MQCVRILSICALRGSFEPTDGFTRILGLAKKAFKLDHTHLVHCRRVTEHRSTLIPLYGLERIFSRAAAFFISELAADSRAVSCSSVTSLGSGLIEGEGFFVVG